MSVGLSASSPGVPMILYAGRLDPTKGLTHLLQAVRQMAGACPFGRLWSRLRCRLRRNSPRGVREVSDVTWLDRRLDVTSLLAAADLVVLPSLAFETQGMVLIEAMSCGTPAVASAVGWAGRDAGRLSRPPGATRRRSGSRCSPGSLGRLAPAFPGPGSGLTPLGGGASRPEPHRRGGVNVVVRTRPLTHLRSLTT